MVLQINSTRSLDLEPEKGDVPFLEGTLPGLVRPHLIAGIGPVRLDSGTEKSVSPGYSDGSAEKLLEFLEAAGNEEQNFTDRYYSAGETAISREEAEAIAAKPDAGDRLKELFARVGITIAGAPKEMIEAIASDPKRFLQEAAAEALLGATPFGKSYEALQLLALLAKGSDGVIKLIQCVGTVAQDSASAEDRTRAVTEALGASHLMSLDAANFILSVAATRLGDAAFSKARSSGDNGSRHAGSTTAVSEDGSAPNTPGPPAELPAVRTNEGGHVSVNGSRFLPGTPHYVEGIGSGVLVRNSKQGGEVFVADADNVPHMNTASGYIPVKGGKVEYFEGSAIITKEIPGTKSSLGVMPGGEVRVSSFQGGRLNVSRLGAVDPNSVKVHTDYLEFIPRDPSKPPLRVPFDSASGVVNYNLQQSFSFTSPKAERPRPTTEEPGYDWTSGVAGDNKAVHLPGPPPLTVESATPNPYLPGAQTRLPTPTFDALSAREKYLAAEQIRLRGTPEHGRVLKALRNVVEAQLYFYTNELVARGELNSKSAQLAQIRGVVERSEAPETASPAVKRPVKIVDPTGEQFNEALRSLEPGEALTIGRHPSNQVQLSDPKVSGAHAVILRLRDGSFEIKDLDSTNGTVVGTKLIRSGIGTLKNGDRVTFGTTTFIMSDASTVTSTSGAPEGALSLTPGYAANRGTATTITNPDELTRRRGNDGVPIDPEYVTKSREGLRYFDDRFWQQKGAFSYEQFVDLNIEMHKLSDYKSGSPGEIRWSTFATSTRPRALEYSEGVFRRYPDLGLGSVPDGPLRIDGVPPEDSPFNISKGEGRGRHVYPPGPGLKSYFRQGAKLLSEIKDGMDSGRDPAELRGLIGDYFHTMVNARPFEAVNYSMYSNQVNYLLKLTGHPGLGRQGDLDHLFMRVDSRQARLLWGEVLKGNFPDSRELDVNGLE